MSLFGKSNMVSPFAMHQQQLAMLAQQQSLLMAAAAKSAPGNTQQLAMLAQQSLLMAAAAKSAPGNTQQPPANGSSIPNQTLPNVGYQISGMMMPVAGQADLQKLIQAMRMGQTQVASSAAYPSSRYILISIFLAVSCNTIGLAMSLVGYDLPVKVVIVFSEPHSTDVL
ncbi:Detected protein of unknown function [Hibiscus syriacus]|uniref:Uncharacterized protein n=1 Tax=Hibiscus syriacus TaxID=106335 RepID=A0A6A2ZLX4_HIBSY|nr:Detected protein of unknown function [Hibiscus syriacus]